MEDGDELHIITTHPNRYASHKVKAKDLEIDGKITVHRIAVPSHQSGMFAQARTFAVYAVTAYRLARKVAPDFLIGTTGRLMTGVLTGASAFWLRKRYFIDLRDIFSETISDLFSRTHRLLGFIARQIFSFLDRRMLKGAAGVNVVSEGFFDYFQNGGIDTSGWSFFPNGVDQEFVSFHSEIDTSSPTVKTVLYAGNIGSGQGLEIIVPFLAKRMDEKFQFVIVGDGGTASLLRETLQREKVENVELILPVDRAELLGYYEKADILFLHLNNVPAFRRVLPSKIFEYAALGKPIVAGLSGYSEQFISNHVEHACVFNSGDIKGAIECFKQVDSLEVFPESIAKFNAQFSRNVIMNKMVNHILLVINYSR